MVVFNKLRFGETRCAPRAGESSDEENIEEQCSGTVLEEQLGFDCSSTERHFK